MAIDIETRLNLLIEEARDVAAEAGGDIIGDCAANHYACRTVEAICVLSRTIATVGLAVITPAKPPAMISGGGWGAP